MAGYKGSMGSSPLDGVANFFAAIGDKKNEVKGKVEDAKDVVNVKAKVQNKLAQKQAEAKANLCKKVGHKGKRGGTCERCPTKIL